MHPVHEREGLRLTPLHGGSNGKGGAPRDRPVAETLNLLLQRLRKRASGASRASQLRFGVTPGREHLGVTIPQLRLLAKPHRLNPALSQALWTCGIHEARILAAYIGDPTRLTRAQMARWSRDFDSWDICDQVCGNLFYKNRLAESLAIEWTRRTPEFARRAGYVLMASLAVHRKDLPDRVFEGYLPVIRAGATDPRNFVRKAVNWALRQIGKRNPRLRRRAIAEARRIARIDSPAARWIAADALRELVR